MTQSGDVVMHKAWFDPLYIIPGSNFGDDVILADAVAFDYEGLIDGTNWYGTIDWTTSKCVFTAWNEIQIDVTGLVKAGLAEVPMGCIAQKTENPSLVTDERIGYGREFTIWSTQPLTENDRKALIGGGLAPPTSPTMPNSWSNDQYPGSMTTSQLFGGRSDVWLLDKQNLQEPFFQRLGFTNAFGMGDPFSTPIIFVTKLHFWYFSPMNLSHNIGELAIDLPGSWELANCLLVEPEEIDFLTTMRRSLLPPGGQVEDIPPYP